MNVFIDSRFADDYRRHPLVLADVGARGGLKKNWAAAREHLRLLGFEPDKREYDRLVDPAHPPEHPTTFFNIALHDRRGPLHLHVARDRGLTSMFEPNRAFIDAFPEADRFDTVDQVDVDADTLDHQLEAQGVRDVDFVKADTQGSELFVLRGASDTLASTVVGVEVEVEFTPIYTGQPLFADVDGFLRGLGFVLFDLRPCYWKRAAGRTAGGPHGQIVWADALYLKGGPALGAAVGRLDPADRRGKILRAVSIALLYGYVDFALELVRAVDDGLSADDRAVIEQRLRAMNPVDALPTFPGRRQLAAGLHRLWKLCRPVPKSWSVSDAEIGNLG